MKYLGNSIRPIALDMASTLFFAAVFVITRSLIAATLIGIAVGIGQVAWLRLRRRNIGALQWASAGLIVVMGAAAILTHDPRLVMIKPTIIYTVVAASMLQPGWITRYMPPEGLVRLPRRLIVGAGYAWAGLMALTAALNVYFAFFTSAPTWALFLAVFPTTSKLAGFAEHFTVFRAIAMRNARAGVTFAPHAA